MPRSSNSAWRLASISRPGRPRAANLEAFIRVIDEELQRAGLDLPPATATPSTVTATK